MSCLGENTVTDLLDAVLSPEQRAGVEAHTSTCDHCRRLVSELLRRSAELATGTPPPAPSPARTLEPGTSIGRYVVREQIGTGATGAVFTAFDPELDRVIALKVLHPGTGAQRERILREARALAKVSHPNVVAAYDIVELDGDLVLAMELVEGTDLRSVTTAGRSTRDVLDAYVQAGRGLAAAHAGGLVHRDFKPANALIGSDGRVRLVDFGLAARGGGTELVGTPAYLAPELFEGAAAEPASDQFAFCVALFEALHGDRPFVANFVDEVARGPSVAIAPGRPPVPARVCAVLARGLRVDPRERFPSMAALLAALAPPRRPARTWLTVGGVATLAGAAAVALALSRAPSHESPCRDSAAVFASVWNPPRAAQIHARFTASGAPFAETAWAAVDRGLSAFATRWTSAQTDACEATRVRGVQSDQILTLRAACLNRALAEVDALATLLGEADRATIEHAASAIDALPALDECANVTALLAPVPPPSGRDAAAVAQIDALLARGRALCAAGRWHDATVVAREAVAAAGAISHEPTRAAAAFLLGEALEGDGAARESEQALRDAFAAAERGRDDLLAARVATELVFVVGQQQSRYDDGLDWVFHAETQLRRAGGDPEIEARLLGNQSHIRYGKAEYSAARALADKAYEMRAKQHGAESLVAAKALYNVARAAMGEGDNAGAIELTRRALAIIERTIGSQHPDLANGLSGLGTIQVNQGKYADALATFDRALAIAEPSLGADHPMIGQLAIVRGVALEQLGRAADAAASYTRARDLFEHAGDKRLLAEALSGLGHAQSLLEDRVAARASFVRALELRKATLGPETEAVAGSLEDLAGLDAELGHHADALAGYRSALAIREKVNGKDYFELAYAHAGIGRAEYALGHAAAAVASLRRAIELLAPYDGDPESLAQMRVALAKAERGTRNL